MNTRLTLSAIVAALVLLNPLVAGEVEVFCGRPPGVVKYVYPEYPPSLRLYGLNGKGRFVLKVNTKTGDVDEVKVLKGTGHVLLNEFCAKAFFQWRFQSSFMPAVSRAIYIINFSFDDKLGLDEIAEEVG